MPKKKAERKVNKRTPDISCTGGSPDSPNNAKKKRRTSNTTTQAQGPPSTPPSNDLGPPPLTGYGDTIIASNPFDDMPPSNINSGNMNQGHGSIPHPQMSSMQYMNMKNMGLGSHMNNPMVGSMSGPMVPSGMMGPNGPGGPMNRGMGGPIGPLGGPMNGPGNGPMGGHINGPMSGLMNMNGMNNMACSMSMNSSMGNGGPGINMSNISSVNNISGMNGPMGNMSCSMNGPGGMNSNQGMQNGPSNMGQKPMPVSSGKIYPSDQPMVFNPQNPNAPPIYPCGMCHKEVHDNDQAILCESGCNFWFHRVCTGLTETAYHQLTTEVYAEWACDKCLHSKNIPLVKFKP